MIRMIALLDDWLRRLIGAAVIIGFIELLLPEGELQRFGRAVMGMVVVLILIQPLAALMHQQIIPEQIFGAVESVQPQARTTTEQTAAAITRAGLAALGDARDEELARSIADLCRDRAGIGIGRIKVTSGSDSRPRIVIWMSEPGYAKTIRDLIVSEYGLPAAAVEVNTGG